MAWSASPLFSVAAASADSLSVTTPSRDSTGCDFIGVYVGFYDGFDLDKVTDNQGNTYTHLSYVEGPSNTTSRFWYCYAPTTSATHTFTAAGDTSNFIYPGMAVVGFSGSAASPYDASCGNIATGSTDLFLGTGSLTSTNANELGIIGVQHGGAWADISINNSFTIAAGVDINGGNGYGVVISYRVFTSPAIHTQTWSSANTTYVFTTAGAAFIAAGGGGATRMNRLPVVGVS